jgi:heat shock protein HtpX
MAALAWSALAVPLIIVGIVVFAIIPGVGWWLGVLVGAVVALALVAVRLRGASARLLQLIGADSASDDEHARFFNLVEGLSLAGGINPPDLHVLDDGARNVAVVARGDHSAIVATTGLLDSLDRIALEGILAEALVRIGNGDAEAATVGSALFGPLVSGPLALVTKPVAARGLRHLLGSERDLLADRAAVALTRYPPGLLAALDLVRGGSAIVGRPDPATDHVWLVPPSAVDPEAEVVIPSASLDLRIDVLGEL